MRHVRLVMLHTGMLLHQFTMSFQFLHGANDHLMHDLALVGHHEPDGFTFFDRDFSRSKAHHVGHVDFDCSRDFLRIALLAECILFRRDRCIHVLLVVGLVAVGMR
ncbi:hypothetical protein D9M69_715930 [compost metagenome]